MVQILPSVPSFGEKLGSALSNAGVQIGQGLAKRKVNLNDARILEDLETNTNLSPIQQFSQFSRLSPERQQSSGPAFSQLLKSQQSTQDQQSVNKIKQIEKDAALADSKRLSTSLREKIPYVGFPAGKAFGGFLNRTASQKKEEFDNEGFLYADKVFTHFNKGTISKDKLAVIRDKLAPNSKYSERINTGRINALDKVVGLPDTSTESEVEKIIKESKKQFENSVQMQDAQGNLYNIPKDEVKSAMEDGLKVNRG